MRRGVVVTGCLAFFALSVVGPARAVVPPGFADVVLFATESIQVKKLTDLDGFTQIEGDVVVNEAGTLTLEKNVTIDGNVSADTLVIKKDASVTGIAAYNTIVNSGSVGGNSTPLPLPVLPVLPTFKTGTPGGGAVLIPAGTTAQLTAGSYGAVSIGAGATLELVGGGEFVFSAISSGIGGAITADALSEILVTGEVFLDESSTVGPASGAPISAADIVFYVDADSDSAVVIAKNSVIDANFWARNGRIHVQKESAVTGAFLAERIQVEKDVTFVLAAFFANRAPDAVDDSATVLEGGVVTELDSAETSVLANDSDFDGDNLSVNRVVSLPSFGELGLQPDGTFLYSHDGGENPSDSFTYEVCDDGTPVECSTAVVTITVLPVNDPPMARDDLATTDEETPVVIDVLANDVDVDGALVPSSVTVVSGGVTTSVNTSTGEITYTPEAGFVGERGFTYEVCDDGTPLPSQCGQATVTVTVNPINDPPTAQPQNVTTSGDTDLGIALSGADPDGDALTFLIKTLPANANGVLYYLMPPAIPGDPPTRVDITDVTSPVALPDNMVFYDPDGANDLLDSFVFFVSDGVLASDDATVQINPGADPADPPTDPPAPDVLAEDQTIEVIDGQTTVITIKGAAPCEGTEVDPCDGVGNDNPLTFSIVSGPTSGSLGPVIQGSEDPQRTATVEYTPAGPGTATFTFKVETPSLETDTAVVTIETNVLAPPPPPEAVPQTVGVQANTALQPIDLLGVPGSETGGTGDNGRGAGNGPIGGNGPSGGPGGDLDGSGGSNNRSVTQTFDDESTFLSALASVIDTFDFETPEFPTATALINGTYAGGATFDAQTYAPGSGFDPLASQSSIDTGGGSFAINATQNLAQTVTPTFTGDVSQIRMPVACDAGITLTIEFQTVSGGEPSGSVLSTYVASSLPTDAVPSTQTIIPIPVGSRPSVSAGVPFAIVLSSPSGGPCRLTTGPDGDPYTGGSGYLSTNSGSSWTPFVTFEIPGLSGNFRDDFPFEIQLFGPFTTSGVQGMSGNGVGGFATGTTGFVNFDGISTSPDSVGFYAMDLTAGEVIRVIVTNGNETTETFEVSLPAGAPKSTPVFFGFTSDQGSLGLLGLQFDGRNASGCTGGDDTCRTWYIDDLTIGSSVALADLEVSSLTHDPLNPTVQDNINFTATVTNSGNASAAASTLMFKIGGETPGGAQTLFQIPSLAPGDSFSVTRTESLIANNYQNTATADWDEDVTESDENNNTTLDFFTVTDEPEPAPLLYIVTSLPANGLLFNSQGVQLQAANLPITLPDSQVQFTPNSGFTGVDEFGFQVSQGGIESAIAMVDLTVFELVGCNTCVDLNIDIVNPILGDVAVFPTTAATSVCGDDCTLEFAPTEVVVLQARPIGTAFFLGWGGACSSAGAAPIVSLPLNSASKTCSATFGFFIP